MQNDANRRTFIKTSTAAAAGAALTSTIARTAHAAGSDEIKFVLIGCGGRGLGATENIMNTKGNVKLVAAADPFVEKAANNIENLGKKNKGKFKDKIDVPQERIFGGLDGYKKAIDVDADLVVIATPPGFKPQQFEYAVNKGRHIFMEKPVASDAIGVRRVLDSVEESKKKNLMVAIGLQRRHEPRYIETIDRIHNGAIGDVITLARLLERFRDLVPQPYRRPNARWRSRSTTGTTSIGFPVTRFASSTSTTWMLVAGSRASIRSSATAWVAVNCGRW